MDKEERIVKVQAEPRVVSYKSTNRIIRALNSNRNVKVNNQIKVVVTNPMPQLDTSKFRFNQAPVETPDGVITEFTLPNSESYVSGLLEVFVNGNQKVKDSEWQEKSGDVTKIEFIGSLATSPLESDEDVRFNYITT